MRDKLLISILAVSFCSLCLQLWQQFSATSSLPPISQLDTQVHESSRGKGVPQTTYELYQVKNTITKYRAQFARCWKRYLEGGGQKKQEGGLKMDWMIDPQGSPSRVEVVSSDFEDQAFIGCIIDEISGMSFPPPPSQRTVYTSNQFNFKKVEAIAE